jgi:hypothetical protein
MNVFLVFRTRTTAFGFLTGGINLAMFILSTKPTCLFSSWMLVLPTVMHSFLNECLRTVFKLELYLTNKRKIWRTKVLPNTPSVSAYALNFYLLEHFYSTVPAGLNFQCFQVRCLLFYWSLSVLRSEPTTFFRFSFIFSSLLRCATAAPPDVHTLAVRNLAVNKDLALPV